MSFYFEQIKYWMETGWRDLIVNKRKVEELDWCNLYFRDQNCSIAILEELKMQLSILLFFMSKLLR